MQQNNLNISIICCVNNIIHITELFFSIYLFFFYLLPHYPVFKMDYSRSEAPVCTCFQNDKQS